MLTLMENNDCLFSDIQNLCNAVSDWLIQKINNPIETNETISCACCHIVITAEPVNAYKVLNRVLPNCSAHTSPLESAIAGYQFQDKIVWTNDLYQKFYSAKKLFPPTSP